MILGAIVFTSASFGLLTREGARFGQVAFNQFVLGLLGGTIVGFICYKIPYRFWGKYSLYFFIFSLLLTASVFIPGLGQAHGGARRWLIIGAFSFQPVELLKLCFIFYFSAWLTSVRDKIGSLKYTVLPLFLMLIPVALILLKQPDHDTLILIAFTGAILFFIAGGKWKHIGMIGGVAVVGLLLILVFQPYILTRVTTFFNPNDDPLGAAYQVRQSLIAVGSGGVFGRGFGQSIQKFEYLPEPIGDSIFAVLGEEFGFIGATMTVLLFLAFALRGLRISANSSDMFGRLTALGIVIIIISQSFLNMMAMLGLFPLAGSPLLFVSHGGTALLLTLAEVGILLNISKYANTHNTNHQ